MPQNARETFDQFYPEMRWRCLSLAADLDRVQRAGASDAATLMRDDVRAQKLRRAIEVLLAEDKEGNRAERVQMIFSDLTPPVVEIRNPKAQIPNKSKILKPKRNP